MVLLLLCVEVASICTSDGMASFKKYILYVIDAYLWIVDIVNQRGGMWCRYINTFCVLDQGQTASAIVTEPKS